MEISFNCLEEAESNIPVSPLHLAVSMMTRLKDFFSFLFLFFVIGYCPFFPLQAYYGHCEALRLLCETLVSLDVRDIEGQTALHLAAQRGFSPCVQVLLEHQASYTLKEHRHKRTALHAAGVCVFVKSKPK